MTDRELLELAAKAAGLIVGEYDGSVRVYDSPHYGGPAFKLTGITYWNPLHDDGDALRLAVKLGLRVVCGNYIRAASVHAYNVPNDPSSKEAHAEEFHADHNGDANAATRRAITRAAAEIGKGMA